MLFRASTPNVLPSRPHVSLPNAAPPLETTYPSHDPTDEEPDHVEAQSAAVVASDRNIPTTGPLVWSGFVSNLEFSASKHECVGVTIRHLDGAHGLYAHLPQHMSIVGFFSVTSIQHCEYVLKTTFEANSRDGKLITLSRLDVNSAENDRKKKIFHDWVQQLRLREMALVLINQQSVGMIYLIPNCALSTSLLKPGVRKEDAQSLLDTGLLCWALHHHKSTTVILLPPLFFLFSRGTQLLPPVISTAVRADCSYDAEGMSLINDPDESEFVRHSDDEHDENHEETGYTAILPHSPALLSSVPFTRFYLSLLFVIFPQFAVHLPAFNLLKGPEVIQEDSEQHPCASSSAPRCSNYPCNNTEIRIIIPAHPWKDAALRDAVEEDRDATIHRIIDEKAVCIYSFMNACSNPHLNLRCRARWRRGGGDVNEFATCATPGAANAIVKRTLSNREKIRG
jgi:hypothetical protein